MLSQAPAADAVTPVLRDIKVMKDDPVAVEAQAVEIKARCQKIFGV